MPASDTARPWPSMIDVANYFGSPALLEWIMAFHFTDLCGEKAVQLPLAAKQPADREFGNVIRRDNHSNRRSISLCGRATTQSDLVPLGEFTSNDSYTENHSHCSPDLLTNQSHIPDLTVPPRAPASPGALESRAELLYALALATTARRNGLSATIASSDANMLPPGAIRNTLSQCPDVCCT
jgi:hypothetical protein